MLSAQQFKAARRGGRRDEGRRASSTSSGWSCSTAVTHPKPLAELLDAAYELYRRGPPVGRRPRSSRPKSVVRDMYERAMTFVEYVGFYGLARSEGLVLRYLADAYKALRQTVPEDARTEELTDLIEWLGELVRQVDSSLIDEWERLRNPTDEPSRRGARTTGRRRSPATCGRSGCWCATRCSAGSTLAALRRYDELGELDGEAGWDAEAWAAALDAVLRGARRDRHRARTRAARPCCIIETGPRPVAGAADLRRPGRRPRLGHQRRGRPGRVRRGRRGRRRITRRRPAVGRTSLTQRDLAQACCQ